MIKFTKKEISLCKQVAERYKKEVKYGDWILYGNNKPWLITEQLKEIQEACYFLMDAFTPLWTISDCLEFLYERYEEVGVESLLPDYWEASVYLHRKIKDAEVIDAKGKTPLEACLKAVLAVLEEKK